jgi:hypothetical protein
MEQIIFFNDMTQLTRKHHHPHHHHNYYHSHHHPYVTINIHFVHTKIPSSNPATSFASFLSAAGAGPDKVTARLFAKFTSALQPGKASVMADAVRGVLGDDSISSWFRRAAVMQFVISRLWIIRSVRPLADAERAVADLLTPKLLTDALRATRTRWSSRPAPRERRRPSRRLCRAAERW